MYRTVKIGGKDVPMMSTAATDFFYRQIFHADPTRIQYSLGEDENENEIIMLDFLQKMGFVMAKNAEISAVSEMVKLSEADFYEWLIQFDRAEYLDALADIRCVYEGQDVTEIESKKNPEEQNEK